MCNVPKCQLKGVTNSIVKLLEGIMKWSEQNHYTDVIENMKSLLAVKLNDKLAEQDNKVIIIFN